MSGVVRWNRDKPHRCPGCHAVVVRGRRPRGWRVYACFQCGARFARWPWLAPVLGRPQQPEGAQYASLQGAPPGGKLVRTEVPKIIRAGGGEPVTYVADRDEYRRRLLVKLAEETREFQEASDEESAWRELADVLEVVRAIAEEWGLRPEELEELRAAKERERGGFGGRLVWMGNRPQRKPPLR